MEGRKLINGVIQLMNKNLPFLLSLTFLFLFCGSSVVVADDFRDGVYAYDSKDYKAAHKILLPLAEQGLAKAQYKFGQCFLLIFTRNPKQ